MHRNFEVPVISSMERIRSIKDPVAPREREAVRELIDAEMPIVASDVRAQYARDAEAVRVQQEALDARRTAAAATTDQARNQLAEAEAKPRSLTRAAVYWTAGLAAGACEFLISWATLPPALEIERDSLMGIIISLSPVIACLALENPIDRFLRSAPKAAVCLFHAMIAGGLIWLGWCMGLARSEISRVLAAVLRGDSSVQFEAEIVNRFILTLSLILVIVAATFVSSAFHWGGPWLETLRGRFRVKWLERAENRLAKHAAKLRGTAVELEVALEEKPRLVADAWRRQALLELAGVEVAVPTADQEVNIRFGLDPQLGKGTRFA